MTDKDDVDPLSLFIFPSDGPKGLEPVKSLGDGNCLYRSVAHLAFGDDRRHKEVRVRVTAEAVKNKHLYIDGEYLYRGSLRRNPKWALWTYSACSHPVILITIGKRKIMKMRCTDPEN